MKLTISVLCLLAVVALQPASAIDVVPHLNLTSYLGRWYQMYGDQAGTAYQPDPYCATADYGLRTDGKVSVFNAQRTGSPTGPPMNVTGYAYVPNKKVPAKLKVHFDVAPIDAPYWVVAVGNRTYAADPACSPCYQYAVVTDSFKVSLFVLARDPELYKAKFDTEVLEFLKENGFTKKYDSPIAVPHSKDCIYAPRPSESIVN